jgi:LmbE family N-acetylglucosaminyl deacetylase
MRLSRFSSLIAFSRLLTALVVLGSVARAEISNPSSGAILEELQRLRETGRVLYLAAHPDDENTRLIAYLANGRHYATAYLSLTRGDGGQNLIGPELRDALGVIRTQELLAARRIDGGRQFFSRANDFGYSKSAEETLTVWDRQEVLSDTIRVIRQFRPDVIVTRFSPTRGGTHGHHTGSAVMAMEAFELAADPQAFADELGHLKPWQPKRMVWNASSWGGPVVGDVMSMEVGGYNAVRGESFGEIAAHSRSQHRSQGFGAVGTRGDANEQFMHLLGEPASGDLMEGVEDAWSHYAGGPVIAAQLDGLIAAFNPLDSRALIEGLFEVRKALAKLPTDDVIVAEKQAQLDQILAATLGLYVEAVVPDVRVAPGENLTLTHGVVQRVVAPYPIQWTGVRYVADNEVVAVNRALKLNENETLQVTRKLPDDTALTHPYWLELPSTAGMAVVADKALIGSPENAPAYAMEFQFEIAGQMLSLAVAPVEVTRDPVRGELRDALQVIPPVAVGFAKSLDRFSPGETRTVSVHATAARGGVNGELELELPIGWTAQPKSVAFSLIAVGNRSDVTFAVTAPMRAESVKLGVRGTVNGRDFDRSPELVTYDHIPVQLLQPKATLIAMSLDLKIRGERVGYLPGAGDTTAEALSLMGYQVKTLTESDLTAEGLAGLDAVVLGIRAYNTKPELMARLPALWEYVEAGGNVIAQYNTTSALPRGDLGPYSFSVSRDRVTDETAAVTLLARNHPALVGPNKITLADFNGWVQERGLYFPNRWDDAYTPLLGMADPGEGQTQGSLLVAKHGDGYFVYTGLSFFRELPAGVSGAYRLLANLVSLE